MKKLLSLVGLCLISSLTVAGTLTEYRADWCQWCKAQSAVLKSIEVKQALRKTHTKLIIIDMTNSSKQMMLPTLVLKLDGKPTVTLKGLQSKETLLGYLGR